MSRSERAVWLLPVIKAFHTVIWLTVEIAFGYLIVTGIRRRRDRLVTTSAAIVAGETIVYLANGATCPLTELAESLGAESGSVTDIYLPKWLARSLPVIHVPLVLLVLYLHRPRSSESPERRSMSRRRVTRVGDDATAQ